MILLSLGNDNIVLIVEKIKEFGKKEERFVIYSVDGFYVEQCKISFVHQNEKFFSTKLVKVNQ